MMTILTSQLSLLLLLLLNITTFHKSICSHHTLVSCNEKDRETLLTFKQSINDSLGLISTWSTGKDCCAWKGVHCDNITGRVTKIDLSDQYLKGEINFSILELEFLSYLDLSDNDFDLISIPTIQNNITHSSKLVYLDLSPLSVGTLHMDNFHWLPPLSSLKYLNLSGIDLRKETNWLQEVATLPSLLELRMIDCNLNNFMINSSFEYSNLSSLVTLDLSGNNFSSQLPNAFFNLTKDITYLGLSFLNIHGNIPSSLLNLQNLRHLNLKNNQLQGSIPNGIGQLPNIQYLDLSRNMFSGSIPSTLGNLSSLSYLSIASNNFSGEISKLTFSKLSSLSSLDLGRLNAVFQFDSEWIPPFQLHTLYMENTNQGPNFPSWIYTQKSLQSLSLSNSGISLVDRNMFWSFVGGIHSLSLSNNSLTGDISNRMLNCHNFKLDHNNLTGGLPNLSPIAQIVDFSYNSFSGSIPRSWKNLEDLVYINLWSNKLSGEALVHLSHLKQLRVIDLGENEFSGTIPIKMPLNLGLLILRANKFEGTIPTQLFNLTSLVHLDLAQNKFSGSMPECVYNLTNMVTLNTFSRYGSTIEFFTKGHDYVYKVRPESRTIDLSANSLSGEVPPELFLLAQVQTLNLSHNNLIGTIPEMIGGMKNMESLDLSNNKFCGEIPQGMAHLNFLGYLNLSCNNFNGNIPMGTQLQSFNASSYIGNPKLCGAPLTFCAREEENRKTATPYRGNENEESMRESFWLGIGVGYGVGFWLICGPLFLIRKWRHTYYRFIDRVGDMIYVTLIVKLNSFLRK